MTQLPIKPGIDGIPTGLIPTDPAAFVDWFKNSFLPRWAANADARNAIPTSSSVIITGDTNTPAGIGIGPNSITNAELVKRSPLSVMGNPTAAVSNVQDIIASADNEALQRIAGALVWAPVVPTIAVADSISGTGAIASPLELVGDAVSPGNSQYYGTSSLGAKGFFPLPTAGSTITTLTQSGGASQTYNVPVGANAVRVICVGGGGGGSSGARLVSGSTTTVGGGGGASGGISVATFRAADLGSSVTVTFSNAATGGAGGTPQTAASGAGIAGTTGSNVSFGGRLIASGGSFGAAGGSGGAAPGVGNWQSGIAGASGGSGSTPGNAGANQSGAALNLTNYANTGGGGGGTVNGVPTANAGGAGGSGTIFMTLAGGTGGVTNAGGGNGSNGSAESPASGGGGGGGGVTTPGNGGNGGAFGGGGGGGGGCTTLATQSGAGGNGGLAACIIIAF